jgi:two-component system, chemotaxis family, sensor kinase CheA
VGHIRISAYHAGERLVFNFEDDGAGFDVVAIRAVANKRGLVDASSSLSEQETLGLLLVPGFSTAKKVTQLSGRGVGLDAVKEVVEKFDGAIKIYSSRSKGAGFQFSFPL